MANADSTDLIETSDQCIMSKARQQVMLNAAIEISAMCELLPLASRIDSAEYAIKGIAARLESLCSVVISGISDTAETAAELQARLCGPHQHMV